jgi:hypothetical protein
MSSHEFSWAPLGSVEFEGKICHQAREIENFLVAFHSKNRFSQFPNPTAHSRRKIPLSFSPHFFLGANCVAPHAGPPFTANPAPHFHRSRHVG